MTEPALDAASLRAIAARGRRAPAPPRRRGRLPRPAHGCQVAARFNVDRSWVYAHANELGVVRLGAGRGRGCASTRPSSRSTCSAAAPPRARPSARSTRTAGTAPLLPIKAPTVAAYLS